MTDTSAAFDPDAVARASGYSWDEIDNHIQDASDAAFDVGYDQRSIDQHLGFDPDMVEARASDLYNTSALTNPRDIDKIDVRGTYADLLRSNSVRSARAFTSALGAVPLSKEGGSSFDDVTEKVSDLTSGLPSRRSFIDASLTLANDTNYDIVRGNLIDHWWETGQAPEDAAEAAGQDGALHSRLTTPPRGLLSELYHAAGRGLGEVYYGIQGIAQHIEGGMSKVGLLYPGDIVSPETAKRDADILRQQIDQFHKNWAPTRDDFAGSMVNLVGDGGATIGSLMAFGGVSQLVGYGALHGADAAWQDTHSLSGAVVGATVGAAEMGIPLKLLQGPEGAGIIRSAVSGALKFGAVGGLSTTLDPLPRAAAGEGYTPPSWSDIGHGIESGAFMGALGGALTRARAPHIREIQPDGTAETVPLREMGQPDLPLHDLAMSNEPITPEMEQSALANRAAEVVVGERVENPIEAYHGSPYHFDKFSSEKINTGEGAQAFGRGLYFAENPGIAESYRRRLSELRNIEVPNLTDEQQRGLDILNEIGPLHRWETSPRRLRENLIANYTTTVNSSIPEEMVTGGRAAVREKIAALKSLDSVALPNATGALYKVKLHLDPDKVLDWDKPISQQPAGVQAALSKLEEQLFGKREEDRNPAFPQPRLGGTGGEVFRQLGSDRIASQKLQEAGLQGIRYFDQGAREAGEGTRNYVVFHDNRIQMLTRNGEEIPQETQPVEALRESYHAAAAFHKFIDGVTPGGLKEIFANQEGALKLPTGGDNWDVAANIIRVATNNKDLGKAGWAAEMEPWIKRMEPDFREYERLRKDGDIEGMLNSKLGMLKRAMQGEAGIVAHPDYDAFVGLARQMHQQSRALIEAADPETKRNWVENYARRMFLDTRNPDNWYGSFVHARSEQDWATSIRAGKEDAISHPILSELFGMGQERAFAMRLLAQDQLTKAGLLKWSDEYPGGDWQRIDGMTKRAPLDESTKPVIDPSQPALPLEMPLAAAPGASWRPRQPTMTLQAYAQGDVAQLLQNWARNFQPTPIDSPRLTTFRRLGNALQQISLAFPAYHAVTEMGHMAGGAVGETARFLGNVLMHPTEISTLAELPGAIAKAVQGGNLRDMMLQYGRALPEDQKAMLANNPILRMAVEGAYRPLGRQDIYRPSAATPFLTALQRGTYTREVSERLNAPAYKLPGVATAELARPLFDLAAPFWDSFIPWAKSGQVLMQIEGWLARHPNASEDERMIAARQISDNVDDRMGEMNWNNLFFSKFTRTVASSSMISLSWLYGTVRQTAATLGLRVRSGGGGGTLEFNPAAMGNLAGLFVVQAGVNALYQYIKTGKLPGEDEDYYPDEVIPPWVRDLVAPRTGGLTKGSAQARTLLPGEVKEFYDWAKIAATAIGRLNAPHGGTEPALQAIGTGLGEYATAKLRNIVRIPLAMASGVDAVGHPIGYGQYTWEWYLLHNVMPIVFSNWEQTRPKANISGWESALGLREMPDWLSDPVRFQHTQNYLAQRNWGQALRRAAQERAWNSPQ